MSKRIIQAAQVAQPVQYTVCLTHNHSLVKREVDFEACKLIARTWLFDSRIVDPRAGQRLREAESVEGSLGLLAILKIIDLIIQQV